MSQNNVDISIKTAVDGQKELTEYQKELIKLGRSSQEVDEQVEVLGETLSDLSKAVKLKEKLSEASEELEVASDNLEKARDAYKRASEEALHFSKTADPKAVKDMNNALVNQEKELKALEQAQSKAQKKYADTNKTIDQYNANIQKLVSNTDYYNESVQKAENAQAKLNAELKNLKEVGEAYQKLGVQDLEKEIKDLENAYKVLKESGKLSADELRQAHEKLTKEVDKHKKALNGTDQAYKDLKTGAIHFLPVAAALVKVTKSAIDYEDAMADVKKVITATDEEFKALSDSLLQMSKTTPVAADGLAKIAAAGAQLGVEVGNLKEFVTITADMSTAFDMSAEDAGKAVASLSNIFGITINDTKELGDAINYLSNNSASEAKQIVDVLVRIGGTGKAIGLTQQQVAALGSTLIAFGKSPEIAGTAIDSFLSRLQMLNTLGPTGQESLDKIGVSAVEMSQKIRDDASGAIVYFLEQVNQLENSEKSGVLTNIFGRGPQADILLMASNVDQLKGQLDLVSESYKYLGSMQDESNSRAATTANQIIIFKNNIDALSISLGSKLLPTINSAVSGATSFVDAVSSFSEMNPEITRYISYLAVAAAGSKLFGASIALAGIKGKAAISSLVTTIKSANSAMGALDLAAKAGIGTLTKFVLPVMALDMAFNLASSAVSTFTEHMKANQAVLEAQQKALKMIEERHRKLADAQNAVKESSASLALQQTKNYDATQSEIDAINQLSAELDRLGLSYNAIEKGISKEGDEAIRTFERISENSFATSKVITQSFGAALNKIKTPEELFQLTSTFNALAENEKIASDVTIKYSEELNKLNNAVMLGMMTESDFTAKKTELVNMIAEQVNGFAALNHEISKQVQLINTQIALDKKLVDSVIRKLEAEKEMAKAMNDTVKVQEIERQIQATRIAGMKDEAKAIAKRTEEYKKELLVLEARKVNGQALTEAEEQRIQRLKVEIAEQNNEVEAINKSAEAKELDIAMSYKNASALDSLAKSANNAANAQQSVSKSIQKTGEESDKSGQRASVFKSWLEGMADESKKSDQAVKDLTNSIQQLNKATAIDATSGGGMWLGRNSEIAKYKSLQNDIVHQINKAEALEKEIQKGAAVGLDAIDAMMATVNELDYVNEEVTANMKENLKQLANEAKNTYATIDRENSEMINNLISARNQDEAHKLRMKHLNERASLESKIMQAQEDGDAMRAQKLRDQKRILQEIQSQEQRNASNERRAQERDRNQKIDINLNGTNLKNLDPDNPQDMRKISEAVVNEIRKDGKKSTQFRIRQKI